MDKEKIDFFKEKLIVEKEKIVNLLEKMKNPDEGGFIKEYCIELSS